MDFTNMNRKSCEKIPKARWEKDLGTGLKPLPPNNISQLHGHSALSVPYCMTLGESRWWQKKTTVMHTLENKLNKIFPTITEIHNLNFISSKIQNPGEKIDENRKPLLLQPPQIHKNFAPKSWQNIVRICWSVCLFTPLVDFLTNA